MSLSERVAAITGATVGLGSVVTRRMAQIGARLALFSSNRAKLDQLVADLALAEPDYLSGALDFHQPEAAKAAAAAMLVKFGRIDLLLHFVGGCEKDGGAFGTMLFEGRTPRTAANP